MRGRLQVLSTYSFGEIFDIISHSVLLEKLVVHGLDV